MKTLITGATGFIGSHILDACIERGDSVRILARRTSVGIDKLKGRVEVAYGDISDYDSVLKACEGMELVFHSAGVVSDWAPYELFYKVNVEGMENICRASVAAGIKRFIWTSTNDVFGRREDTVINESLPLEKWNEPYPDTKIMAEEIAWRYHREKGLAVSTVYPLWVYGPRDTTFVPLLADAIIKKDMVFWQYGTICWPTYIGNLVDLLMLISTNDKSIGQGYLVHDGELTTLEDFCRGIASAMGVELVEKRLSYPVAYAAAMAMEASYKFLKRSKRPLLTTYSVKNLGSRLKFSTHKAEDELGWKPKTSFREGFKITMEWLKTQDIDKLKQK
jgi:nucleoside-diphosphate-sugar epimerase